MSKIITHTIIAAFAATLTACGGGGETLDASPTPPPTEQPEPTPTDTTDSQPSVDIASAETPQSEGSPEFADLPAPYNTADYSRGKRVFRTCSSCHLLDPEAGNLVGPNLHGMFDRKAGELEGYTFSNVVAQADFQWTPEALDNWLSNPNSFLPGNNMSFTGVRREKDRMAVIAYLLVETKQ